MIVSITPLHDRLDGLFLLEIDDRENQQSAELRLTQTELLQIRDAINTHTLEHYAPSPMKWCQPCGSYHVDPKSKKHHSELQCFRPWDDWQKERQEQA